MGHAGQLWREVVNHHHDYLAVGGDMQHGWCNEASGELLAGNPTGAEQQGLLPSAVLDVLELQVEFQALSPRFPSLGMGRVELKEQSWSASQPWSLELGGGVQMQKAVWCTGPSETRLAQLDPTLVASVKYWVRRIRLRDLAK